MSFDAKAYDAEILKPLVKDKAQLAEIQRAVREIQDSAGAKELAGLDLRRLLAIPTDTGDLTAHLESVKRHLNKRNTMSAAQLLHKLIAVLESSGVGITTPAFWNQLTSAKTEALKAKVLEFAAAIAAEHQALKVITRENLEEKARTQGFLATVSIGELAAAVQGVGIAVRPDFELPRTAVPRAISELSKHTEYRSIIDVLLLAESGRPTSIRVIDTLTYGAGSAISPAHVAAASKAAESGKDSDALQAAQKALTLIRADFLDPTSLHQLVLATFVANAQEMLARGELLASALARLSSDTGLDAIDAARLLSKLSGTASTRGLRDVTNLLAEGALADARRTFVAVADPQQFDAAEIERVEGLLTAAEQRKSTSVAAYEAAMKARDYGAAASALSQAVNVDKQDSRLQKLLENLPPAAPEHLVAKQIADGAVLLSWSYGNEDARFIVVRNTGRHAPANAADGAQLVRDHPGNVFADSNAPVGKWTYYSVFAEKRGITSLPASAKQIVLPAPADVSASTSLTEVTLMWRLATEAVGLQITRINPDGTKVPVNAPSGSRVTVSGLATGSRYRFVLEAIYILQDGSRVVSPSVSVDATPRGAMKAVTDLLVGDARLPDGRDGHRATWIEPGGFPVELWSFPVDVKLPNTGTEVVLDELDSIDGRRVGGVLGAVDGRTGLNFGKLRELRTVAAITVDGDRGLFGTTAVVGSAPNVRNARVDRHGDELVVSWEWPHGDYSAAVTWSQHGALESRRCTRAEYKGEGGFRIRHAAEINRISVATVAFGNGSEWMSQPVEIVLPAQLPIISYELDIPPLRFGRRKCVRAVVHPNGYKGQLSLTAVVRTGSIMPSCIDDGEAVKQLDLRLDDTTPVEAEFDIPRAKSPFWVRLFLNNHTAKLQDPPTNQLKG